ncbi:MAG: M20 family metallopeptidase [bacterium]
MAELLPELIKLQKTIHDNPELSLEEHKAAELLAGFLEREGFRVQKGLADIETSFRAERGDASRRPRIAFLAEYDALPGLGHACGHSIIAAASAGAAAALARCFPDAPVSVVGTPAEEIGWGKIPLLQAGAFDGIDLGLMVHPSSRRQVIKLFLGVVQRTVTFHGKAAHAAAYPEEGINALDGVVLFYNAVASLRQQLPDQCRVHMIITDGGKAPNIIPAEARALCVVRALDLPVLGDALKKVEDCARGAAHASGASVEIEPARHLVMPLRVNRTLSGLYREELKELGLVEYEGPEDKGIGSSDIGNLSQAMPVIHPHVPIGEPGSVSIHTREFEEAAGGPAGENAVQEGAALLALTACRVLKEPESWSRIKKEFEDSDTPVPEDMT